MRNDNYFIVDDLLPDALNFEVLKQDGIKQLQTLSGKVWTNYNESDPGITILDQLCYALTELGYCAQFPIADVLTQEDGKIQVQDQFFEPQNILTCAPVTLDDYRKLVLDNIPQVRVIYIEPEPQFTGRYHTYLGLKGRVEPIEEKQVIHRVQVLLNQHRNLAELFLRPNILTPFDIQLAGHVWLTQASNATKVESLIMQALLNYAAPLAVQSGYKELLAQGLELDEIFNGPKSCNGWIAGENALKGQCLKISLADLTTLIAGIDGVEYVASLSMSAPGDPKNDPKGDPKGDPNVIHIKTTQIPSFTLSDTFKLLRNGNAISAQPNQSNQSTQSYLAELSAKHQSASLEAKADLFPECPSGHYRNIEEYYSVQNTFPDIYGIGYNSLQSDATNYRVAQSRQLKGYLMAFDQLLANQFSQVAHIGDLFSFGAHQAKSGNTGLPDVGIPHKKFATTYHCQPLYDIPQVKPLLRGHDVFQYQFDSGKSDNQVEHEAWKKYKQFQFNEYIYGLRQRMESDLEATTRRDAMLSHLMARHGDDANLYHDMIETCQWFGSEFKTRIIVKTIWLQNYEFLSYHRTRAWNINTLKRLPMPGDASIMDDIKQQDTCQSLSADASPSYAVNAFPSNPMDVKGVGRFEQQAWWSRPSFPTLDGEVDQAKIYAKAKLKRPDFDDFSAFELKAGILLGLPARWRSLAGKLYALLNASSFHTWLSQPEATYHLPDSDMSVVRIQGKEQLYEGNQCLLDIVCTSAPTANDYQDHADQLLWLSTQCQGFLLIESILLHTPLSLKSSKPYFLNASLIFPNYVTLIQQPKFQSFIDTLVSLHWPAHVETAYLTKSFDDMKTIISGYVDWKNKRDTFNFFQMALSQKQPEDPTLHATKKATKEASERLARSKKELASQLGLPLEQGAGGQS